MHLFWVRSVPRAGSGGLRFASTTGYYLSTLLVEDPEKIKRLTNGKPEDRGPPLNLLHWRFYCLSRIQELQTTIAQLLVQVRDVFSDEFVQLGKEVV